MCGLSVLQKGLFRTRTNLLAAPLPIYAAEAVAAFIPDIDGQLRWRLRFT